MTNQYTCSLCHGFFEAKDFTFRERNGNITHGSYCKSCKNKKRNEHRYSVEYACRRKQLTQEAIAKNKHNRLHGLNTVVYLYQDSRKSDKKRGLENDLDHSFINESLAKPCSYCEATDERMTLDRVDNDLGHIKANVVPACYRCNLVRGSMPIEAWRVIAPAMKQAYEQGLFGDWRKEPISRKKGR